MEIRKIGVIGAGQMGAGIAQVAAQAGYQTVLTDVFPECLERGMKYVRGNLDRAIEKGKLTLDEKTKALDLMSTSAALEGLAEADMVIEAIVENTDVKLDLFKRLDRIVKKGAIFASNTSSISITQLGAATSRPELMIGMHFMNPVPVMKLVEIIRGLQTNDTAYENTKAVSERMGKTTVLAIDGPGFVVNRVLVPMINEAIFLVQEGVKPEDIDTAMKLGTNQPMGPLELADFVGLDTLLSILRVLQREMGDDKYRACPLLVKYVEAGWYGKKTGRGFYKYS